MHSVLSKLPFAIFLLITLPSQYGSTPLSPPPRAPGDKVVIVVHNDSYGGIGPAPLPPMGKEIRAERKSIFAGLGTTLGLKRQGHFMTKSPSSEDSGGKKEKSLLSKLIPSSSRHVSGPADMFRKNFHHSVKGPPPPKEKRPGPSFTDFRPHQPDITPGIGKYLDEPNFASLMPRPTPMANKLNPYTNGVAASFPPGIDPYDGFMRYAAENLETPMGNLIDYQSLEHYYGPQHPLSPHHNKDVSLNQPYADHFTSYNGNDIGNSPPSPPIRDGPPPPPPTFHGGGFRVDSNNPSGHGNIGGRNNHPNSLNNYEHGIDHFDAPSPGPLHSAPPRPRPPSEQALYEEGLGHRNPPPFDDNPEFPPYRQNHHGPPFKQGNSPPEHHHPEPPDMDVFDEGPPPPSHLPITGPSGEGQTHPEVQQSNNDGGDDSIWGILDLAEMIEKGEIPIPGQENTASSPPKSFNQAHHKPPPLPPSPFQNSPGGGGGKRIVIPIFTRPPPPRQSSNPAHDVPDDDHPPPHSSSPHKFSDNSDGYDYDEHPEGGGEGEGGNFPQDANKRLPQYGGPLDSHESNNDYADDSYKKK